MSVTFVFPEHSYKFFNDLPAHTRKILGKINREDKVTILVVEQNAQLALELADKA